MTTGSVLAHALGNDPERLTSPGYRCTAPVARQEIPGERTIR
jgi:hypothetical protein